MRNRATGASLGARLGLAAILVAACVFVQTRKSGRADAETTTTRSAERVPNFSGVWMEEKRIDTFSPQEPPMQAWAKAKYNAVKAGYGPHASAESQDPILKCLPPGVPRIMLIPFPMQITQTPGEVVMLFEYDHFVRQIYTDRRTHPKDVDVTWMGDSIGRWEGETLVVDTIGLNDKSWLDQVGHPHSDQLHVVERIRRTDHDTLEDDITIDDPKAFTAKWSGRQIFKLRPTWHLMEYVCEDPMEGAGK